MEIKINKKSTFVQITNKNYNTSLSFHSCKWMFHFKVNKRNALGVTGREERLWSVQYHGRSSFQLIPNSVFTITEQEGSYWLDLAQMNWSHFFGNNITYLKKKGRSINHGFSFSFLHFHEIFIELWFLYPGLLSWVLANGEKSVV